MLKRFVFASVLVVLVTLASGADAFTSDKRTYFTFNQSVTLPGVTLPAGTYMFRLADPDTTRRVIQVSNREGTESYALLLSMPTYRVDPKGDSEVRFLETPAGTPHAVNAWWYAGESIGYQFQYSKSQLEALNRVTQPSPVANLAPVAPENSESSAEPVPAIADPVTSPSVVEGEGVPAEAEPDSAARLEAQNQAQAPAPEQQSVTPTDRSELPQTAGPFGLFLLVGAAAGTVGARLLRKS